MVRRLRPAPAPAVAVGAAAGAHQQQPTRTTQRARKRGPGTASRRSRGRRLAGQGPRSSAKRSARFAQLWPGGELRRRRPITGSRPTARPLARRPPRRPPGCRPATTRSVSSQRMAGSDVATTGSPAARYSSVFIGKLLAVELGRSVGDQADIDQLQVGGKLLESTGRRPRRRCSRSTRRSNRAGSKAGSFGPTSSSETPASATASSSAEVGPAVDVADEAGDGPFEVDVAGRGRSRRRPRRRRRRSRSAGARPARPRSCQRVTAISLTATTRSEDRARRSSASPEALRVGAPSTRRAADGIVLPPVHAPLLAAGAVDVQAARRSR